MSDPDPNVAAAPAARRNGVAWLFALVVLLALVLAVPAAWRVWTTVRHQGATLAEANAARERDADVLARQAGDIAALRRELDTLSRRLGDSEAVNRALREEVLGLGERAKLVEDAVTSLADRRMAGAVALRLNEAEFLLRLGQERLALFGDSASTIAAFELADAELAQLDDPMFASVRQTLAAELATLRERPAPGVDASVRIDAVARVLPQLPARRAPAAMDAAASDDDAWYARALRELGRFVRIRRIDPAGPALASPLDVEFARSVVALELVLARAGIAAGDFPRARAALERAAERLDAGFATNDDAVGRARGELVAISRALDGAQLPVPGGTLSELRNLRATRALAQPMASDVVVAPAPAATPAPAFAPEPQATPAPEPEPMPEAAPVPEAAPAPDEDGSQ